MDYISTALLDIAYESGGPEDGLPVVLLHGWPDDALGWRRVAARLHAAGFRTYAPWLRGHGETRFRSADTFRDGRAVALAQDALDFADALGLEGFAVAGHDWGARTAYTLSAIAPERLSAIAALALGYTPRGAFPVPNFEQSRRWWYQWFMTFDGGAEALAADPVGFDRLQWDTWGPPNWYEEADFQETAKSFRNPDWVPVTLHAYRSRWQTVPVDPGYAALQARVADTVPLATPTLMIQGAADACDPPGESAGLDEYFTAGYQRIVLPDVGHFPQREAPDAVADALVAHFCDHA
ncbi:alpha/beta hydrolase [uncultured Sphingomonas sp.]|uniref:alpha/beta fold hydrolase n=1 Tax=uncultured Sphingomonas sp. TaxID=158754 RepID=UPI0025E8ED21|nr:alpha/beta hydrolase [uncultured Sphingomonas sp.]